MVSFFQKLCTRTSYFHYLLMLKTQCAEATKVKASEAEKKCKPCCVGKKMFKPQELPLYGCPECPSKFDVIEATPCQLEAAVKGVRLAVTPTLMAIKQMSDRGVEIVDTAVAHTKSSWKYVSSEGNTTVRGIAILSGGLVGMIVARRGFFRKLIFGSIGATAVAANVYPEEYKKYKTETKTVVCATVKTATGYELDAALNKIQFPKLSEYMPSDLSFSSLFGNSAEKKE
ncbi:uncharacterized protein LOC111246571 isoform X1 [Varroa destructor]|uniref:MICOS complex subunit n=2 Tax=Varroa TaxID=62624 RepID=A0A7M7JHY0_VARDE|nr:uncharacterized protein LOC111246571 isoform X1 [Varroa destructor]